MVPKRLPQLGVFQRRVALDPRPKEVLWAESDFRPGGPRLRACGRIPCDEGEKLDGLLARLVRTPWLRDAEVSIAIRHPDMNVQRLDLPKLSARDARSVASRRARELADDCLEPTSWACVIAGGSRPRPAWLVTCPDEFARFAEQRWTQLGLRVAHFASSQLALGSLMHALPPRDDGSLVAFLDISNDHAICVLSDREGWVFGREIPIKIARAARSRDGSDPAERLATELRRTFDYVESERGAGAAGALLLSGTRRRLPELAEQLGAHLDLQVALAGDAIVAGPAATADPALAGVIGLALEPRARAGALLPAEPRRRVSRARATRLLLAAALVPLLLLTFGSGRLGWMMSSLASQRELLERTWAEGSGYRARAEAAHAERAAAEGVTRARALIAEPKPRWAALFRSLGRMLPPDAFVVAIEADERDGDWLAAMRLEFRGGDLAEAAEAGRRFAEALDRSPLFAVRSVEREPAPRRTAPLLDADPVVRTHYRLEAVLAPVRSGGEQNVAGRSGGEGERRG